MISSLSYMLSLFWKELGMQFELELFACYIIRCDISGAPVASEPLPQESPVLVEPMPSKSGMQEHFPIVVDGRDEMFPVLEEHGTVTPSLR